MFKKILKRILPEHFVWWLCKVFPAKPFLDDVVKSERIVEYGWVYQHLPAQGKVLDVGSSGSWFAHSLASLGYQVSALDWKKVDSTHPNMVGISCDIMDIAGFEKYDAVTCISALEHIALREDWKKVVNHLYGLLKPEGILLITVPCGKPVALNGYVVFDVDAFHRADYFKMITKGLWVKCTKEEVRCSEMRNKDEVKSIMCATIRRNNV